MLFSNFPPMGVTQNPMLKSLYTVTWTDGEAPSPPGTEFIITQTGDFIVTETGERMITE